MKRAALVLLLGVIAATFGCGAGTEDPAPNENPFFVEWATPFGVPPWGDIAVEHYLPAFDRAIAEEKQEVDVIAQNPEAPTFDNTIGALDATGRLLSRVSGVFYTLTSSETNDELQEIAKQVAPLTSNLRDDVLMNPQLFARVKIVYEQRDELDLTAEQRHLLEETYLDFVGGGAELDDAGKQRLREINTRLSTLTLQFGDNVLAETNGFKLVVVDRADLAGLPEGVIEAASEAAERAGETGKWVFTLQSPSIWPFLQNADNRELRREILTAYITRCDHDDEHDNKAVLREIAALRAESAKLLGYDSHADFVLRRRMAKNPANVNDLLTDLWHPALGVARDEAAALQAAIAADGKDFELEPWDWRYYADKVRRERYQVDEQAVRSYFELDNVMDGAFYVANRLYGVNFTERDGHPHLPP